MLRVQSKIGAILVFFRKIFIVNYSATKILKEMRR